MTSGGPHEYDEDSRGVGASAVVAVAFSLVTDRDYTASWLQMVRVAVFAIVLSLAGAPAVGVVCGLLCEGDGTAAAQHAGCQGKTSGNSFERLTAAHACDHLTAVAPFVLQASQDVSNVQIATTTVPVVLGSGSGHFSPLGAWLAPPGSGGVVLHSRSPILRI